jgi:hypothetical protein
MQPRKGYLIRQLAFDRFQVFPDDSQKGVNKAMQRLVVCCPCPPYNNLSSRWISGGNPIILRVRVIVETSECSTLGGTATQALTSLETSSTIRVFLVPDE